MLPAVTGPRIDPPATMRRPSPTSRHSERARGVVRCRWPAKLHCMDANLEQRAKALRSMPPGEAAGWLLREHPLGSPDWGVALQLMEHVSFPRREWMRLASHY